MGGADEDDHEGGDDAEEPSRGGEGHGGGFEEVWPDQSCGDIFEEDRVFFGRG